jgi:hypothetical protein
MTKTGLTKNIGEKILLQKLAQCLAKYAGNRKVVEPVGPSPQPKVT